MTATDPDVSTVSVTIDGVEIQANPGELLIDAAERHGVDPHLLLAIFREESRFDPEAVSPASARGLGQFILPTAQRLGRDIGLDSQPVEPAGRVAGGGRGAAGRKVVETRGNCRQ